MINSVKAEDYACKISLSSSKTSLQPGDEVTINILISDITVNEGIQYISAIFDYSTDVFEIIYDESDLAEEKLVEFEEGSEEEGNVAMLYVGENDISATGNKWDIVLLYDQDTNTNGILAYSNEKQTQAQTIGKIKLKVKSDAPKTDTRISIEEVAVFSEGDEDEGKKVGDAYVPFSVNGKEPSASENIIKENKVNIVNIENKKSNENINDTSGTGAPYTGIEDYMPAIVVIITIAIISYFNYKKYKDIK